MNILIIGMGEVGFHLAAELSRSKHAVTVIDPDPAKVKRVGEECDVQTLCGDASHPSVLDQAEAAASDLVVAVSDHDQVNLLCCLLARRMGAGKAIVRVKDMRPYRNYRSLLRRNLLFDVMISLEDLAAEEIAKIVRRNRAVAVENFFGGRVTLRVLPVQEKSPLLGRPLKDIKVPKGVHVVAVFRDEQTMIPDGSFEFVEEDRIYVLGLPDAVERFESWVGHRRGRTRRVVIFGGSNVALEAARQLESKGLRVHLLVDDPKRAEDFSASLKPGSVFDVQGADLSAFKEEQLSKVDAFVAASRLDEKNLLSCQIAREMGCERTIALVGKPDYTDLYQTIGITRAVSPRVLCSNAIVDLIHAGRMRLLATFDGGAAKVCEAVVQPDSMLVGKRLQEGPFPSGCRVGVIQREDPDEGMKVIVASGEDEILAGDHLVLFLLQEVESRIDSLLGGR